MKEILFEWNPWWVEKYEFEGVKRDIFEHIKQWINRKEIISLIGVRRSGKTTLFYEIINYLLHEKKISNENIFFIKADDDRINPENLIDKTIEEYKKEFNPKSKIFLFIDEIQEISNWEKTLKRIYDLNKNIKIFISGSNASLLKEETSSFLAGRFAYFEIFPFSFKEYLSAKKIEWKDKKLILNKYLIKKNLEIYAQEGSFPEVTLEKKSKLKKELIRFYFDSIFYRDIIKRKKIRNPVKMEKLIKYFFQNISNQINFSKAGKIVDLTTDSVGEYAKFLEEAYLMFIINFFGYSYKKQIINPKKIYSVDVGIRNIVGFKFSEDIGRLCENIIAIELKRRNKEIYYWQNSKKQEVDFVIKNNDNSLIGINVSYTDEINEREIRSLLDFKKQFKQCKELIILTENLEKKEKGINFIPLWMWLLN